MRTLPLLAAAALAALTATGCEPSEPQPAAPPVTVTATQTPPAETSSPPVAVPSPTLTKMTAARIRVPRVVGMNHQEAQNLLQSKGLFMLQERDATGQGRLLLWDRNWVVVRQKPKAGTRVTPDETITLYSKKIGE
ncbi:PASTA domain-containing protein [Actinomadura formosensis]|uniref:PASTA domain-containing protein n=1 Tax=Actinomadura formosensis TaxID=60706 RepID=UPI003D929957